MAQKQQEKKPKSNASFGGSSTKPMFTSVNLEPVDDLLEQLEQATAPKEDNRSCRCF